MKKIHLFFVSSVLLLVNHGYAGCVYGAKDKTKYSRLDNHTIVLQGGYGSNILIKTHCYIYNTSEVQILKDSFCSYESAVMYIDGDVCDANNVEKL